LAWRSAANEVGAFDAFRGWKFSHVLELWHVGPVFFSSIITKVLYFHAPNRFKSAGLFKAEFKPADSGK
jgi:hypothetical protein